MRLKCLMCQLLGSVCVTFTMLVLMIVLVPPTEAAAQGVAEIPQPAVVMFYNEVDILQTARIIDAEYGSCPSLKEKASVAWVVCNRARDGRWSGNISEVIFQPNQFHTAGMPAQPSAESLMIAQDVLMRWNLEMNGAGDVGRTIPPEVCFFKGDGKKNHFSDRNSGGNIYEPVLGPYYN